MRRRLLVAVLAAGALLALLPAAPAASTTLVINELDYDQPSTDTAEFLELRNNGTAAVDLGAYTLELVNGNGGAVYLTAALPSVDLAPGGHFMVCGNQATVPGCDLDLNPDTDLIQNGPAPDGARIVTGGTTVDSVSYEGAMTGVTEGTSAPADRTDRGLEFVDRPGGTAVNSTAVVDGAAAPQLTFSPGRLDPSNPAFLNSRKPLAGEFRWRGETLFAVANHFNSKGGDQPLLGRFRPPSRVTEAQRHQQAEVVRAFVEQALDVDRRARVIVLGDLNDFEFSRTLDIVESAPMVNLMETLKRDARYSYVFDGNSQTLDQILVTRSLRRRAEYDSVHVNAEFFDQASDHDPQVARLR
jgi:predicted extracellular nuclease